jgi:hypothetical protein
MAASKIGPQPSDYVEKKEKVTNRTAQIVSGVASLKSIFFLDVFSFFYIKLNNHLCQQTLN